MIAVESQPSQLLVENLNHQDQNQYEQAGSDYWSRIGVTKIIRIRTKMKKIMLIAFLIPDVMMMKVQVQMQST